jgi:hypothetical protein
MMTLCAILSALCVVILYLGSLVEVLDLSVAVIASLPVIVLVIERGRGYPWMIYGVTAILSLLLLPNKFPALVYAAFAGFYPILKEKIEGLRLRPVRLLIKLSLFNLSVLLMWLLARAIMGEVPLGAHVAVIAALLNGVFLFYDYALSVLITSYLRVWRRRLKMYRFFEK